MLRSIILWLISLFTYSFALGQVNSKWLMGYDSGLGPPNGNILFDFGNGNLAISNPSRIMNFTSTNSIICDSLGNFLFSSNGIFIMNASNDTMYNGSGLNPGPFTSSWGNSFGALPLIQGNLILPILYYDSLYILFHLTCNNNLSPVRPTELLFSMIDMRLDNGLGGVVQKNQVVLSDTIAPGMLTACKHANGRDWWIITKEDNGSTIYKLLLTPSGIFITTQIAAGINGHLGAQACFSPDGTKYAIFDENNAFHVYNFDRCTGVLSNVQYLIINDGFPAGGLSFSPDSKKLYASSLMHIYQYLDSASNMASTKTVVATYDGYYSPQPPFASNFYIHQIGKDGKIYINSANSVVDMHVINQPDSLGLACDVCQHCIPMGAYNTLSIPNQPNYYLGPLIGSICDSLSVGIAALNSTNNNIKIYPNPAIDYFWLDYDISHASGNGKIIIYNTLGEVVMQKTIYNYFKTVKVDCSNFSQGIYYILIEQNNRKVGSGKFVRQ